MQQKNEPLRQVPGNPANGTLHSAHFPIFLPGYQLALIFGNTQASLTLILNFLISFTAHGCNMANCQLHQRFVIFTAKKA